MNIKPFCNLFLYCFIMFTTIYTMENKYSPLPIPEKSTESNERTKLTQPLLVAIYSENLEHLITLLHEGAYLDDEDALQHAADRVLMNRILTNNNKRRKQILIECLKFQNTNFHNQQTKQKHLQCVANILASHPKFRSVKQLQSYGHEMDMDDPIIKTNQYIMCAKKFLVQTLQNSSYFYMVNLIFAIKNPDELYNLLSIIHEASTLNFNQSACLGTEHLVVDALLNNWEQRSVEKLIQLEASPHGTKQISEKSTESDGKIKLITPVLLAINANKLEHLRTLLHHGAYLDDEYALQRAATRVLTNNDKKREQILIECLKFQNTNFHTQEIKLKHLQHVANILASHPGFCSVKRLQLYAHETHALAPEEKNEGWHLVV